MHSLNGCDYKSFVLIVDFYTYVLGRNFGYGYDCLGYGNLATGSTVLDSSHEK